MILKNLSIVIPVYNEEDNIFPLIAEIVTAIDQSIKYEIIMVDDASSDATPRILKEAAQKYPQLKIIRHQKNAGQSAALLTGIRAARHDWIGTLDGDGQNNPADFKLLIAALRDEHTACLGIRLKRQDNFIRQCSSQIANNVRRILLKDNSPDTGCGIKLFSKAAFLKLPHFRNFHRFLPALLKRSQIKVVNVPVSHRERRFGVSKYGVFNRLWVGIVDLLGVAWLMRRSLETPVHDDISKL